MQITDNIYYIGVNDKKIDLFEGQYKVSNGMAYNSYLISDEKIAVMDSVEKSFGAEWISNIEKILNGKKPDYLIIQHMEPDHSANIGMFMEKFPEAIIVSGTKSFPMIKQFFGTDYADRMIAVNDGDILSLGSHTLNFINAPMVHWPEVIMTYEASTKTLFSADGFGKFGTIDANEEWIDEARRYYIGIVGKFGVQVQNVLKKATTLDIARICALHGPVLTDNLGYYIDLYDKWSSYTPEEDGLLIAYSSVYGNTEEAVMLLKEELDALNYKNVEIMNLARCDIHEAVALAFKYSKMVLASTTYNGGLFPYMKEFINHLTERNYKNRKVGIIENGSWAATVDKNIKKALETSVGITYFDTLVSIKSKANNDNKEQIKNLANEIIK
ncbi:MAG: FprA family A-type flavoprotein [Ruminococcaceae bacterium]|nr:FprA family A-type flavoprotein [Oscillospiraceae bacterium]